MSVIDGRLDITGSLGVGGQNEVPHAFALDIIPKHLTGPDQCALRFRPVFKHTALIDVVSASTSVSEVGENTEIGLFVGWSYNDATKAAGSLIHHQLGFDCRDLNAGSGTNIAYRGQLVNGSEKWNLFMDGTAPNYLQGQLFIGQQRDLGSGCKVQVGGYDGDYASSTGIGVHGNSHFLSGLKVGGNFECSGLTKTAASATGGAGFHLTPGVAPSSPQDGDVWMTNDGLFYRANGITKGPL